MRTSPTPSSPLSVMTRTKVRLRHAVPITALFTSTIFILHSPPPADTLATFDLLRAYWPAPPREWPVRQHRAATARRLGSNAQAGPARSLHGAHALGSAQATYFRDACQLDTCSPHYAVQMLDKPQQQY